MDDTARAAAAAAAPKIDDPLADTDADAAYRTALAGALELAEEGRVFDLARAIANPERGDLVSALLCHELASCHRLMMRFGAMADDYLSHTSPTIDAARQQVGRDAIGFAAIAARLMARYRQGALALPKLRADVDGGTKQIVVDWGADDDEGGGHGPGNDPPAGPTGRAPAGALGGAAAPRRRASAPDGVPNRSTRDTAHASTRRRGRLRNGNPSGDYLAAPRCGARTRAGCACRQPAMKNGRCRLHGGKSTGARTADGRRRAGTARLVHGRRTNAVIGLRSAAAAVNRRLAWMTEIAREFSAGHGVDRPDPLPPLGDARREIGVPAAAVSPKTAVSRLSPPRKSGPIFQRPVSMDPDFRRGDNGEWDSAKRAGANSASLRLCASAVDLSSLLPLDREWIKTRSRTAGAAECRQANPPR
jgi:hypothetical protein